MAAVGGAILTVLSSDVKCLVAGQLLVGLGCSPVWLVPLLTDRHGLTLIESGTLSCRYSTQNI